VTQNGSQLHLLHFFSFSCDQAKAAKMELGSFKYFRLRQALRRDRQGRFDGI